MEIHIKEHHGTAMYTIAGIQMKLRFEFREIIHRESTHAHMKSKHFALESVLKYIAKVRLGYKHNWSLQTITN